jgi:hypothetical protein
MTVLDNLMLDCHPLMRPGILSSGLYRELASKEQEVVHRAIDRGIIYFCKIIHRPL